MRFLNTLLILIVSIFLANISFAKDLSENIIISYRKHEVRHKPYIVFLHG